MLRKDSDAASVGKLTRRGNATLSRDPLSVLFEANAYSPGKINGQIPWMYFRPGFDTPCLRPVIAYHRPGADDMAKRRAWSRHEQLAAFCHLEWSLFELAV